MLVALRWNAYPPPRRAGRRARCLQLLVMPSTKLSSDVLELELVLQPRLGTMAADLSAVGSR